MTLFRGCPLVVLLLFFFLLLDVLPPPLLLPAGGQWFPLNFNGIKQKQGDNKEGIDTNQDWTEHADPNSSSPSSSSSSSSLLSYPSPHQNFPKLRQEFSSLKTEVSNILLLVKTQGEEKKLLSQQIQQVTHQYGESMKHLSAVVQQLTQLTEANQSMSKEITLLNQKDKQMGLQLFYANSNLSAFQSKCDDLESRLSSLSGQTSLLQTGLITLVLAMACVAGITWGIKKERNYRMKLSPSYRLSSPTAVVLIDCSSSTSYLGGLLAQQLHGKLSSEIKINCFAAKLENKDSVLGEACNWLQSRASSLKGEGSHSSPGLIVCIYFLIKEGTRSVVRTDSIPKEETDRILMQQLLPRVESRRVFLLLDMNYGPVDGSRLQSVARDGFFHIPLEQGRCEAAPLAQAIREFATQNKAIPTNSHLN